MVWLNGQPTETVSVSDRSFQYGDGGFTTILTVQGKLVVWQYHLERMQSCLDALRIPHPDWNQVLNWLEMAAIDAPLAGLKLHISRGEGGRGYSPTQVSAPNVTISNFAYPEHYAQLKHHGVELAVCSVALGINPLLAGHKHNNRLEQVLCKADVESQGLADGVVLDINQHVIETTMANLFWRKGNNLYTPDLSSSGVAGVVRRQVLALAEREQIDTHIGHYCLDALIQADEVMVCNSIMGIAPVVKVAQQHFEIGIMTRRIQEMLSP